MRFPLIPFAAAILLPGWVAAAIAQEPAPAPAPAPAAAKEENPRPRPLAAADLDVLLVRAERNLFLHAISLESRHLRLAEMDYRAAVQGLPETIDGDRRFTALFGLAFAVARMELPADPAARKAQADDAFDLLDRASRVESTPPGIYAASPGLWIVDGLVQEQVGEVAAAEKQITRGFAELEKDRVLRPEQAYQLRLFGLLARGRAFLLPPLNAEHLAEKDFKEALLLAEEGLKSPLAPRENRLRTVVLTHLAAAYQSFDYYDKAEAVLADLIRTDPANAVHPYNMALVKAIQQKYPEALAWYRKSADLDRADPRPHLKIAFILLKYPDPGKEPDTASAVREGEIYLRLRGGTHDAEYCALRGEAAWLRNDMKEAEAWFRRALVINPNCRTALQRMMNILGQKEDPTGEVQKEIDEMRKRLQKPDPKMDRGPGMETKRTDLTFC